jgi:uncharacterized membrane protein
MRPTARALTWLAVFLIVDAGVYMATAREWTGGPLIAATAGAFAYLALVLGGAARRAARELKAEPSAEVGAVELDHVGPTIWPAGFALAAILLALGTAVARWLLIPGGILFVAAAIGWALDIRHQHQLHHGPPEGQGPGAVSPGSEAPAP